MKMDKAYTARTLLQLLLLMAGTGGGATEVRSNRESA
jgi:hypothetical protein